MISACYVIHNEAELIAESIRSVKAYVDHFVFLDVVFTTNPINAVASTDRTREIAESTAAPLPVSYIEGNRKFDLDEARNLALAKCQEWCLTIDGDETLLGERSEVREVINEIQSGERLDPYGVTVYSAALRFDGHAPAIGQDAYQSLPVVYTKGDQPRLFPVAGMRWRQVPNGGSYGLYRDDVLIKARPPDPRLIMVNHRTRQTFEAYQNDYTWETALL